MYIIGIDYGHGETSAAVLEIDNELYEEIAQLEEQDYSTSETEPTPLSNIIASLGSKPSVNPVFSD